MVKIIHGFHSVSASLNNNPQSIDTIYCDKSRRDKRMQELLALAHKLSAKVVLCEISVLRGMLPNAKHQGVAALLVTSRESEATVDPIDACTARHQSYGLEDLFTSLADKQSEIVLILDGVTDPHNLGAIIRTADCFGVSAVILPKNNSALPDNVAVHKTSSGAVSHVPVIVVNNLSRTIEQLQDKGFWVAGTTLGDGATDLYEFEPSNFQAWVLGSEGGGIRRLVAEHCDHLITIPMHGVTQSLNVSVTVGVVLSYTQYRYAAARAKLK